MFSLNFRQLWVLVCLGLQLFLTQPEATRSQSARVPGAGVLIGSDWCELQHPLGPGPVDAHGPQVHEDQVVVSAPWNGGEYENFQFNVY